MHLVLQFQKQQVLFGQNQQMVLVKRKDACIRNVKIINFVKIN